MKKIDNGKGKKCVIDFTEKRFSRLVVSSFVGVRDRPNGKGTETFWLCRCDCGINVEATSNHLKSGDIKSCGCLSEEYKRSLTTHGMKKTSFWLAWKNLRGRCNNKKDINYKNYGGRGIKHDERWNAFLEFKKDMYFKYLYAKKKYHFELKNKKDILSIERKDVNGNYCKENCEFIPRRMQGKNRRTNRWFKAISPKGKIYTSNHQTDFAKEHNLNISSINACLRGRYQQHRKWIFKYCG